MTRHSQMFRPGLWSGEVQAVACTVAEIVLLLWRRVFDPEQQVVGNGRPQGHTFDFGLTSNPYLLDAPLRTSLGVNTLH